MGPQGGSTVKWSFFYGSDRTVQTIRCAAFLAHNTYSDSFRFFLSFLCFFDFFLCFFFFFFFFSSSSELSSPLSDSDSAPLWSPAEDARLCFFFLPEIPIKTKYF